MNTPDQAGIDRARQTLGACPAPDGISLRFWAEADFAAVQDLSSAEGWTTPQERPAASLAAWRASWPAIIAEADGQGVGFLRAISDGAVSTYVTGRLIAPAGRGRGLGRARPGPVRRWCRRPALTCCPSQTRSPSMPGWAFGRRPAFAVAGYARSGPAQPGGQVLRPPVVNYFVMAPS